jgi:hypothetical protein
MSVTPAYLLYLVPVGLLLLGGIVAMALLLANPKTQDGAKTLLKYLVILMALAIPLAALMIPLAAVTHLSMTPNTYSFVSEPGRVSIHNGPSDEIVRQAEALRAAQESPAAESVDKGKDAASQAAATGILRAMVRALGGALAEEERIMAAAKKSSAKDAAPKSLPSPAGKGPDSVPSPAGRWAGGEGGSAASKPALTLALSQRERGPDLVASQRERGPNSTVSQTKRGPEKPPARPAWVNATPRLVGDAYQVSIAVGPYTTPAECDARLPEAVQQSLDEYSEICLMGQAGRSIRLKLSPDELRRLVKERWEEVRQHSVGPMTWLHALVSFDHKMKDRVLQQYRRSIVDERLLLTGVWAALALGLLATVFGYLKIDLATGGVYRGRLRLAAALVILALVALAVVV